MKKYLVLLLALALLACSKALPQDKWNYEGEWRAKGMVLRITKDGNLAYQRKDGRVSTEINAPVREFQGNDFIAGVGPFTTTFVVSVPPHNDAGVWKMTVDGVELTRQ